MGGGGGGGVECLTVAGFFDKFLRIFVCVFGIGFILFEQAADKLLLEDLAALKST